MQLLDIVGLDRKGCVVRRCGVRLSPVSHRREPEGGQTCEVLVVRSGERGRSAADWSVGGGEYFANQLACVGKIDLGAI